MKANVTLFILIQKISTDFGLTVPENVDLESVSTVWDIADMLVGVALLITLGIVIKKLSRNEQGASNYLVWWLVALIVYVVIRTALKP